MNDKTEMSTYYLCFEKTVVCVNNNRSTKREDNTDKLLEVVYHHTTIFLKLTISSFTISYYN